MRLTTRVMFTVIILLMSWPEAVFAQRRADAPPTLAEMVDALRVVAGSYPPRVANDQERFNAFLAWQQVEQGIKDYLSSRTTADFNGELLAGDIYRMGHNLDVPGAAEKAIKHLEAAIAIDSTNPAPHYLLGFHLTHINRSAEGLPELLLAYALADEAGRESALHGLALNYYLQKNFALALVFADRFSERHPGVGIIEQIRTSSREALATGRVPKTIEIQQD